MDKKNRKDNKNKSVKTHNGLLITVSIAFIVLIVVVLLSGSGTDDPKEVPFNEFTEMAEAGKVKSVQIELGYGENFTFEDVDGNLYVTENPKNSGFKRELLEYGIEVYEISSISWVNVILTILQYGLIVVFFIWMVRRMMPQTKTASVVSEVPRVGFDDVAGAQELKNDLKFVIEYLRNPMRFKEMGATLPKGIVLYGPPGTGKTLIAKAVAGSAGVPFFNVTGSDFVEMYVGLGASRVRNLFKQAREAAPCIVFIDEIDAVGGARGGNLSHSEANQTINALLSELDGFNGSEGVLVIAATNRLEDLDPALIRPGRFDRQLAVPLPEKEDRMAILKVHRRNKKFAKNIDWEEIAATTVGFSGAALASMLNEAAFIAASNKANEISKADIDRAFYKILMKGDQKNDQSKRDIDELTVCSYHEAGHAIATRLYTNDRVPKVTIISSTSGAGGVTFRTPTEKGLISKKYLEGVVKVMYAGRAAEEVFFNDKDRITTGAASDISKASMILRDYISVYGMSDDLGLVNMNALGNANAGLVAQKATELAKRLYSEVVKDLTEHRELLDDFANTLLKEESLGEAEIEAIFGRYGLSEGGNELRTAQAEANCGIEAQKNSEHTEEKHSEPAEPIRDETQENVSSEPADSVNSSLGFQMFSAYIHELNKISGDVPACKHQIASEYIRIKEGMTEEWIDIHADSMDPNSPIVGFLIVGINGNCHPEADVFIEEAYIRPEYRHLGHMRKAIARLIKERPGKYCFFVLHQNALAKKVWPSIFDTLGYEPYPLEGNPMPERCELHGFSPKKDGATE